MSVDAHFDRGLVAYSRSSSLEAILLPVAFAASLLLSSSNITESLLIVSEGAVWSSSEAQPLLSEEDLLRLSSLRFKGEGIWRGEQEEASSLLRLLNGEDELLTIETERGCNTRWLIPDRMVIPLTRARTAEVADNSPRLLFPLLWVAPPSTERSRGPDLSLLR